MDDATKIKQLQRILARQSGCKPEQIEIGLFGTYKDGVHVSYNCPSLDDETKHISCSTIISWWTLAFA